MLPAAPHEAGHGAGQRWMVGPLGRHEARPAAGLDRRGQSLDPQPVCLGPTAGEHDLLARPPDQRGDPVPRGLDQVPGRATLPVDRGWVPGEAHRRDHRLARGRYQRRGRVVVQVDPRIR